MKKSLLRALCFTMVSALFITACSKDKDSTEEEETLQEYSIVGKWKATHIGTFYFKSGNEYNVSEDDARFELNADGSGIAVFNEGDDPDQITWKSEDRPDYVVLSGYSFVIKEISENDVLLLEDPLSIEDVFEVTDETISFGVRLKRVN